MTRVAYPCLEASCGRRVAKGIQCDACNRWAHPNCSRIPNALYQFYRENEGVEWVCGHCKGVARKAWIAAEMLRVSDKATAETNQDQQRPATNPETTEGKKPTALKEQALQPKVRSPIEGQADPPQVLKTGGPEGKTTPTALLNNRAVPAKAVGPGKKGPTKGRAQVAQRGIPIPPCENGLHQLEQKLEELSSEIQKLKATHRETRNPTKKVLVLNTEEPVIKESKSRRELDRRRVGEVLRLAGISLNVGIKRAHRVGAWKQGNRGSEGNARPILIEFRETGPRDQLLAKSSLVEEKSNGRYRIVPDCPKQGRENWVLRSRLPSQARTPSKTPSPQIATQNPGFVVVEDIIEEDKWRTCLQSRVRSHSCTSLRTLEKTPLLRVSSTDPTAANPDSSRTYAQVAQELSPKNVFSPRVLRPRVKQD